MLRWHIHYNLLVLRAISFAADLHWTRSKRPPRVKGLPPDTLPNADLDLRVGGTGGVSALGVSVHWGVSAHAAGSSLAKGAEPWGPVTTPELGCAATVSEPMSLQPEEAGSSGSGGNVSLLNRCWQGCHVEALVSSARHAVFSHCRNCHGITLTTQLRAAVQRSM
jgi:hypothetical protein